MNKKVNHKTIGKYFLRLLFFSLLLLCSGESFSQAIYPVQVTTQVIPPYTPDVVRYYTGTQQKLRLTLTNLDMQEPTLNVYLRMKITSSSFSIITPPEVYTPTIQLQAGVPLQLSLNDLEPYFKKENMRISGGQSKFYQTMQLPDNFYRFQFEVYEVRTNELLSNPRIGFAQMMIAAGEPPFLNLPRIGSKIEESNIPNILFTWTPRHMNSVASAYGTEYEFTLVEIYDKRTAPENAFQYSRVLYSERTRSTAFTHTAAQPMLIPGMRYAWRVQAIAKEGIEDVNVFKNNGYSQIYWFDYTIHCPAVQEFGAILENMKANITWVNNKASDYTVEYRKKGSNKWYTGNISNNNLCTVYNLKYGETYEYRIGSRCLINDDYQYSTKKAFTTPERLEKSPNCGLMPNVNLTDRAPIRELITGVPVFAGDFPVTITKVVNSGGRFTGEGYVGIPYMKLPRVAVTFKNISVNSQYQLIDGYFETKFDLDKNMVWDVDKTLTGGKGVGDIRSGEELADFKVDYTINPDIKVKPLNDDRTEDEIKAGKDYTIQKNENGKYQFVITDSDGNKHEIESDKIPVTIQDKSGNTYEINEKGEMSTISQSSDILLNDETKDKIRVDIAEITFEETDNTKYALDVYRDVYAQVTEYFQTYKPSDRESAASAKFMVSAQSDEIFVKLKKAKLKNFDPNKVHFITSKGKEYTGTYDNNKQGWTVTLLGSEANDGQELYVIYDEVINKPATLARLNLYSYKPTTINVKLVPVNGFDNGFTQSSVEKELNAIYNKVGINCRVEIASNFDYEPLRNTAFKVDGSGFFSTQTNDMKQLNAAYLAENPEEKALCLFILQNVDGNNSILGDMPRGKQFGYLFRGSTSHTIAHEIGHGLFHLDHPFARANGSKSFEKGALADNLMEYQGGTHLAKLQWDMIHSPGLVIGLFEKDGDGMIKSDSYFWTPSGHVIYLENPSSGITNINMPIPNGTLYGFKNNGIQYNAKIENNLFYGYQSGEGKIFKDKTAEKLKKESGKITVISRIYNGNCTVSEYSNTVPLNKVEGLSNYSKGIPLQKNNEYYLKKEGKHTLVSVENCSQVLKDYGQKVYDANLSKVNTEEAKAVLFEIAKLADELGQTYLEGIQKGGKWDNDPESSNSYFAYYWALLKDKSDYSPESLQKVVESLKGYKKAIDQFNEISDNGTCTKEEILSIINGYFVFGQDKKYLFDAPITALNAEQRINILQVLVKGTVSGRMNIGSDWQEEDIILEILKTAPADQWQALYNKFNNSNLLIDMMRGVDNENFNTMCQTILENTKEFIGIPSNPVDLDAYLTNNRYLNFDNSYFSRHNNERLNDDGTIYLAVKGWFYTDKDIIMPNLKPFEKILVNIVYENDLIGGKTLTPIELPAFYVYALFNKDTNVALFKSGMFTIDVLSLAVGIGEVKLALSTANYLRLAWALGDVAISGINMATYTTFEDEIKSEYPNFHANLWKVSAVWGITNIAVNSKNISKEVKEVYDEATDIAANSRYSRSTRKTAEDIVSEINKRAETDVELYNIIRRGVKEELDNFFKGLPRITNKLDNISNEGKLMGRYVDGKLIVEGNINVAQSWDFIVTIRGEVLVGRKHSWLSKGEDVLAAGELKFRNGEIIEINNLSGHYNPSVEETENFLRILKHANVNVDNATLSIYGITDISKDYFGIVKQIHPTSGTRNNYY